MSRTFFISVICNYNFVVNLLFNSLIWQLRDSFYSHIFGLEIDLFTLQPGAVPIEIPSKKKSESQGEQSTLSHTGTANLNKFSGCLAPLIIISLEKSHFFCWKEYISRGGKNINSHPCCWWISEFCMSMNILKVYLWFFSSLHTNIFSKKFNFQNLMISKIIIFWI